MTYDVVLTDPPWAYYGSPDKMAAAGKHYGLLDYAGISALTPPLVDRNSILFMWTTSAFMDRSIQLLNDWGLFYRGVSFVWVKVKKDGTPFGARGVRPSITKPLTEFVIAGSPMAKGRPLKLHDESICQTVFAQVREHSRKPDEVHERIERMYPQATKLEMFARTVRPGWDTFGNETERFA